jgi:glucose/arabinose dehydrogenase
MAVALLLLAAVASSEASGLVRIALEPVVTAGLSNPVFVTHARDGSGRLFVLEQRGLIRIVAGGALLPTAFLNIVPKVLSGGERGLLGLAFHPGYATNGRYFVNYTRRDDGHTVIAEYGVSGDANVSATTERVLLVIEQPEKNHNGGMIAFGADGYLYIGMGDGGGVRDPQNRGQNTEELLGKMLRIDVNQGTPYGIPPDNPFVGGGGRAEIWAMGFRNPWRFSFDRQTNELYLGDVGQRQWEEIDIVRRGGNYGWKVMEGFHCLDGLPCSTEGFDLPVAEYAHDAVRCSVTGGYVYRGRVIPRLAGAYVYGDYCSGEIFVLRGTRARVLLPTTLSISSFGEDETGEMYVVDRRSGVYRITVGR